MGATPIYQLRFPEPTDPADVPTDMHELATDVEAALGLRAGYGTTLPANPVNGQEHVLVPSTTNPDYQWRFRYNANSSSPYKWEQIGGYGQFAQIPTNETAATTGVWVDLSTVGPTFTLPRSGEWVFEWGADIYATVISQASVGLSRNGAAPTVSATSYFGASLPNSPSMSLMIGALTAGDVMTLKYNASPGVNASFRNRWLLTTPRRVS